MTTSRRLEILGRLVGGGQSDPGSTTRLCEVCRDVAGATGAGIMLISDDAPQGSICNTNDVSALMERLQFDLGEGPCIDAHTNGAPVAEVDLAAPDLPRWLAFGPLAVDAGARAVFGFPLRVGAARIGALNLYRDRIGALSDREHGDALIAADIAAHAVLLMQAGAAPGSLAAELETGGEFHYVVHQAAGMVAAQLEVNVVDALVRLRAYAFGNGLNLADVARDVVGRRLRLDWRSS